MRSRDQSDVGADPRRALSLSKGVGPSEEGAHTGAPLQRNGFRRGEPRVRPHRRAITRIAPTIGILLLLPSCSTPRATQRTTPPAPPQAVIVGTCGGDGGGGKLVRAHGAVLNDAMSGQAAQREALLRARVAAAEAVESRVLAQTFDAIVGDRDVFGLYNRIVASGLIVAEKAVQAPPAVVGNAVEYRVDIEACVAPVDMAKAVPVRAELNKSVFAAGEALRVSVTCERDCYVYVFNLTADDRVTPLLPAAYWRDNRLTAGTRADLPPQGVTWPVEPPTGQTRSSEALLIAAMRSPPPVPTPTKGFASFPAFEAWAAQSDGVGIALLPYEVTAR